MLLAGMRKRSQKQMEKANKLAEAKIRILQEQLWSSRKHEEAIQGLEDEYA